MAELLIFIRNASTTTGHWMDRPGIYESLHLKIDNDARLTTAQKIEAKEHLSDKYTARYQSGDILEVREDGYFCEPNEKTGHGWDHACFALVKCPKLTLKAAETFADPIKNGIRFIKRRRFALASAGLRAGEIKSYDTSEDLISAMEDKNG